MDNIKRNSRDQKCNLKHIKPIGMPVVLLIHVLKGCLDTIDLG